MEDLKKPLHRPNVMTFKVTNSESCELRDFVKERGWNLSAFIRVALKESMASVVAREEEDNNDS